MTEQVSQTYAKVIGLLNGKTYLKSQAGVLYDAYTKKQVGVLNEMNSRVKEFQELNADQEEYWKKSYNAYSELMKKRSEEKRTTVCQMMFERYNACDINSFVANKGSRVDSCR